jgi:hypothetical protein
LGLEEVDSQFDFLQTVSQFLQTSVGSTYMIMQTSSALKLLFCKFETFLLCKQGYECLEFADNAIVDGAYTYNTITSLTKGEKRLLGNEVCNFEEFCRFTVATSFEVHNQFHIVKIQIAELLWQNRFGIFSDDL